MKPGTDNQWPDKSDAIISYAVRLLQSDKPLSWRDRMRIAWLITTLSQPTRRDSQRFENKMAKALWDLRKRELIASGMKPGKAEETIARDEGIDVYTLRKRIQRAK
jgi:hypothetical protein